MDFVEIRKRARERAGARGTAAPAAQPPPRLPEEDAVLPGVIELPPELEPLGLEEPPHEEAAPAAEAILDPAPRWPGLDAGDAFVAALREELVGDAAAGEAAAVADAGPPAASTAEWAVPGWTAAPEPPPLPPIAEPAPQGWTVATRAPVEPPPEPEPDPLADFFFDPAEAAPAFDAPGAAPGEPQHVEGSDARRELLGFFLGAEEYAVDIEQVREVLKAPAITEVPRAPGHVLGVIMVRGEVIAVFDPRRRLGLPPVPPSRTSRVLVCDGGEGPIGLLVDAVSQVVRLRRSDVEPRPQGIGGAAAEYIAGIGRERDHLFILLDLRAILRGAPVKEARA